VIHSDSGESNQVQSLKPLHIQVAEALGWFEIEPGNGMDLSNPYWGYPPFPIGVPVICRKQLVPRYDEEWEATGPLIERFKINLSHFINSGQINGKRGESLWRASTDEKSQWGYGLEPLMAICALILALKIDGRFGVMVESQHAPQTDGLLSRG
jgi:hypothetical protein